MSELTIPITCVWSDDLLDAITEQARDVTEELKGRVADKHYLLERVIRRKEWHGELSDIRDANTGNYKLQVTLEFDDGRCLFDAEVDIEPHVYDTVNHILEEESDELRREKR